MSNKPIELELLGDASRWLRNRLANDRKFVIAILIVSAVGFSWLLAPPQPSPKAASAPAEQLTEVEVDHVRILMEAGRSRADAVAFVIERRPSKEEQRRLDHELREKDRQAREIYQQLCADQPWLERCN